MKRDWGLVFLLCFFISLPIKAATITMTSDLWCPYTCDPHSENPGYIVEVTREIFEKKGYKVDYKTINWARAVSETKDGNFSVLLGASRADVPGFILPTLPVGMSANYFWVRKDSSWNYKNIESLKNKKIGVINTYTYGDEVDAQVQNRHKSYVIISGNDALLKIIKMTDVKRLDGFVENPFVLNYIFKDFPQYKNLFKNVSRNIANDPELFVAFSPAKIESKKYAGIFSEGMKQLRKSGRLKIILEKYGIGDWDNK